MTYTKKIESRKCVVSSLLIQLVTFSAKGSCSGSFGPKFHSWVSFDPNSSPLWSDPIKEQLNPKHTLMWYDLAWPQIDTLNRVVEHTRQRWVGYDEPSFNYTATDFWTHESTQVAIVQGPILIPKSHQVALFF